MFYLGLIAVVVLAAVGGGIAGRIWGPAPKLEKIIKTLHPTLAAAFPQVVRGALCILAPRAQVTTTKIWIVLQGEITARIPATFAFDLDVPIDAMRAIGRRRDLTAKRLFGDGGAGDFAAFLEAHRRPRATADAMLPYDVQQLAGMQALTWKVCNDAHWPVLCPDVGFIDVAKAPEILGFTPP